MFVPKYELLFGKQQFDSSYNLNRNFTGATSPSYWLASSYVETFHDGVLWGLRRVLEEHVDSNYLFGSYAIVCNYSYGVRPVVSMQSGIELEWNSTDQEWKIQ